MTEILAKFNQLEVRKILKSILYIFKAILYFIPLGNAIQVAKRYYWGPWQNNSQNWLLNTVVVRMFGFYLLKACFRIKKCKLCAIYSWINIDQAEIKIRKVYVYDVFCNFVVTWVAALEILYNSSIKGTLNKVYNLKKMRKKETCEA